MTLALLSLKLPSRPAQELPAGIRRQLPDPLASFEQLQRFEHLDIEGMTTAERNAERWRLQVAIAQLKSDQEVPSWFVERLRLLLKGVA